MREKTIRIVATMALTTLSWGFVELATNTHVMGMTTWYLIASATTGFCAVGVAIWGIP